MSRSFRIGARTTEERRELRALRRADHARRETRRDWQHIGPAPDWAHDAGMQYERTGDDGRTEYARELPADQRPAVSQRMRDHARQMAEAAESLAKEFGR